VRFRDILYGQIDLPDWLSPFIRSPEFVRLRGVGLSNVDSVELKDFNGPSRWEHGIAVAWLAAQCASAGRLPVKQSMELVVAGLLHDVATPPFAHTAESVLASFDHEVETHNILAAHFSDSAWPGAPVFESELPQFRRLCDRVSRDEGVRLDPDEVASMVVGDGQLGYLVAGTVDLDNLDNVTRACLYLGSEVDRILPVRLARWLGRQSGPPVDLEQLDNADLSIWLQYRQALYSTFFNASDEELGREALLQHLMRRALRGGLHRRSLIWNTEDQLLSTIATIDDGPRSATDVGLAELVRRYRLLEPNRRLLAVAIEDEESLRALQSPQAASWIERQLSGPDLEVSVLIAARRWGRSDGEKLIHEPPGALLVFKLGTEWYHDQLPEWLRARIGVAVRGKRLTREVSRVMTAQIAAWTSELPWFEASAARRESVRDALESIGDWGFRLSRNDSFHAYPSTFVHAIPASLISALGLRHQTIVDPFGGTGQTAIEAVKCGGGAITSDANAIATRVARARLTYLSAVRRKYLRSLTVLDIRNAHPVAAPAYHLRDKWHHPATLDELCLVYGFIVSCADSVTRQFLETCFSAVLPATTDRRGLQHGFFADNTPLKRGRTAPEYHEVIEPFLAKVLRNVDLTERMYSLIERDGRLAERELDRVRVLRLDALTASPDDYGVVRHSLPAIITSPPYLGMSDYALGNRLSYYWLERESLDADFRIEMGARRKRFASGTVVQNYFGDMKRFAALAHGLLRPGGMLATVLGTPEATAFRDLDVLNEVDRILTEAGLDLLWSRVRAISWHRNHGYQRLRTERVAVYVAQ
jgi:HD superfamily phosphohydrolase